MSIRAVVSNVVSKLDIAFAEGEDGHALLHESKDIFTIALRDLNLSCKEREV